MEKEIVLQEITAVYQVRKDVEMPLEKVYSSYQVADFLKKEIGQLTQERFVALFLNVKNEVIAYSVIGIGTIDQAIAHPRDLFQRALLTNSASILIAHNHPSGNPSPSENDKNLTKRIKNGCELFGLTLLDHIIVGNSDYYSFRAGRLL